ncbi:MAG TPA: histidine kinase dimerization/phospho-acceptor domain-containing protein, partial [Flavobacterium sp.]|nr:histidine kinase dimerization/phospho-acceptor domain-containing protein [Flavobacterium sp.]
NIVIANPAFLNLVGKRKEEVFNKTLSDVIPGLDETISKSHTAFDTELQLDSVEGKPWVGVSVATIFNGTDARKVLSFWDITAEKQFEQMQNDFIATATHELRTPLTAILGYLSMLNNKSEELNDKQKLYLQRIGQASKNLSALVEDLLSALRLDQDTQKQSHDKQRLLPIIKDVVHSLEPKAINKHIKISQPKKSATVYADSHALQKVLLNLVDNAIKYSRPYSKISISLKRHNNSHKFVEVGIRDTGVGIPRKEQANFSKSFIAYPMNYLLKLAEQVLAYTLHVS